MSTKKYSENHFFNNSGIIDTIMQKSHLKQSDTVLAIGVDCNSIIKLLTHSKSVLFYGTDKRQVQEIKLKVSANRDIKNKFKIIDCDIVEYEIPNIDVVISCVSFNLTCPIVLKLMSSNFRCAFILVQKEFADKLLAKSGSNDYSKLSVVTQLMSKIEHVLKVSKNSYSPPLNIDTYFVKIQLRSPKVPIDVMEFERLLKFCFNRKNKLLSSNLNCPQFHSHIVNVIECDKKEASRLVLQIIANCDFKTTRPSKMHVEDFLKLLLEFKKTGVSF